MDLAAVKTDLVCFISYFFLFFMAELKERKAGFYVFGFDARC